MLGLLLLLLGAPSARAQDQTAAACLAAPLRSAEILGCEASACPTPEDAARFLSLADLRPGVTLTAAHVKLIGTRFAETRLFARTVVGCRRTEDDRVHAVVTVTPNIFVRRVLVEGNQFFKQRDILKRVFLRAGTVLDADPAQPEQSEQIQRQIQSLSRLYRNAGLERVTIDVDIAPAEKVAGAVDLTFRILEGERARIESIRIR
ncbi:MAG: outer membrane protein assembly factor BamA, partial [Myxococcota bacterium]